VKRQAEDFVAKCGNRNDITADISQVQTRSWTVVFEVRTGKNKGLRKTIDLSVSGMTPFDPTGCNMDCAVDLINTLFRSDNELTNGSFDRLSVFGLRDQKHFDRVAGRWNVYPASLLCIDRLL